MLLHIHLLEEQQNHAWEVVVLLLSSRPFTEILRDMTVDPLVAWLQAFKGFSLCLYVSVS